MDTSPHIGICRVCQLSGDLTEKEVTWCGRCGVFKCDRCQGIVRSIKGFVLDKIGRLVSVG